MAALVPATRPEPARHLSASVRVSLLQLVWISLSVGWCTAPHIVVTRESQAGENLVNAQIVESTMAGSRAHVVLMIGCNTLDLPQECANLQQLNDMQRTACVAPMRFLEPTTPTGGVTWAAVDGFVSDVSRSFATVQADEPHQLTLTLDGGAVQPGESHSTVLTIRHAFRQYSEAQWWKWSSNWQDATIALNFSVQPPDYYVLAIPQDTAVELRAGEVAVRTFTLYNVRSTAVNWRISSGFQCPGAVIGSGGPTSAGGHAWLSITPAIPVDRSCSNVMLPHAPEALQFNITAPENIPSNDLAYSLVIECQDAVGAEYVWVESQRTVQLNIDFTVTVKPGYPDPVESNFELVEPQGTVSAGGVLQIEVFARDEFGNSDTDAGLHFTMQTRSADLAGVVREQVDEMVSYFENGRYLIDSDTLLPGLYTISVSFMAQDGAQSLHIQRDSTGSAHLEQEVAPIVCNDGQVPHPDTGTICIFCEPGKHPARNGNTCENCPAGKHSTLGTCATCGYGMTVSADQTSCESCPPFSSPLNSTSSTCVCDVGYVHNETKVGLNVSTEEYEDSIRRDVDGMHFKGTDCQGKTPCCDVCPTGAVCRRGSRPGHLTIYPDVGMWIDITGEYLGKPLTVVPCPSQSCPGYCKLRDSKGLLADPIETGCKGERGVDWSKYSLAEFDEWIDDHVRRTDPSFPNACKNGASGVVCAACDSNTDGKLYKKVEGICVACTHFPVWAAVLSLLMYTLLCLFFVHKSRRIETGVDCDAHISSSIVGILVFFMQTAMLLPQDGLAIFELKWVAEAFKPLATVLRLWPDLTDDDSDSCFSTGIFIADYTAKFLVPFFILGITWFLSRHVLRLKARQVHMGLLFSVQFGLFPVIMNSVSTFFCRDDLREFAGVPKPPAPAVFAPCTKARCAPSHFSLWWDDMTVPRRSRIPEICTTTLPVRDMPTGQEPTPEQYRAIEQGCHLDFSSNRLRLDPGRECTGLDYYIASFAGVLIAIFCTVCIPVWLYYILAKKMQQHERLLRISMYMKYGIDRGMTMIVNDPLWKSGHSPEFAAQDPFSFLYYPLRRQCFWWSIVWIFRPAAIAIVYSARDRHTLVAFEMADWRMLAVMILMIYNTVQATVRPFKHLNESQLDATSVLLLMLLFSVSINVDMMRYNIGSDDHDALLGLVSWFGVLILSTVIAAALLSKRRTNKHIKRKIAQQHWKMAWTNMSAESDPLSQMLDDDTTGDQHWTKRSKHVNTALKMGVRTKLPVFEQIDVDGSNVVDLDEFLQWWHLRTLRHGGKNNGAHIDNSHSVQSLAERLFHQYDTDRSGSVTRDEFEPILKELHAQYQDNQQKLRAQRSLPVQQAELQHEKQRVLDRIGSFPRFTVSKMLSIPDEHGHQFEYYRVDETNLATNSAETGISTNPVYQPSSSFEVEGGNATSALEPRRPSEPTEATTSRSPDESLKSASDSKSVSASPTVREIFDEIDADGSGEITIEELTSWWRQQTNKSDDARLLPKLEEAFSIVEYRDGVPGVSLSEFEEVILVVALDDWEVTMDADTGKQYYVNRITRESSWTEPNKGCINAFLRAAGVSRTQANVRNELQQRQLQADVAPVTSRSWNKETSSVSDRLHSPHRSRSGPLVQLTSPRQDHDLDAASLTASRSEPEVRKIQVMEEAKAKRRATRLSGGSLTVPNVSFVSASVIAESSMIKKIVAAACLGSGTLSNDVYIDGFMAFLQTAQSTGLPKTDTLALQRHFNEAFANSSAAGQEAPAALSVQELRHCLASLVNQDYTKGVDPKSGRAYYVHKQTRVPVWVIDAAAVDACLGRFFGKVG